MLVRLGLVEQSHKAVIEVLCVTDVAERYGVVRQTVHQWLRRYAATGIAGLLEQSSRPQTCPHQMAAAVEAKAVDIRRKHRSGGRRASATSWPRTPG